MSDARSRRREPWDDWAEPERRAGGERLFTPVRLLLLLLVFIAAAVTAYGLFVDKSSLQLPITVSGLAVLGVALGLLAFSSAAAAAGFGRQGRLGWALLIAFFGGLCAIAAAGSLGAGLVLGILATAG